jgi:hypothetical protein
VSVLPVPFSASVAVPEMLVGLPGVSTTYAAVAPCQACVVIARVESPTNFLANDGTPATRCSWSTTTRTASPSVSTVALLERAPVASPTWSQNSGSVSIARTWSGGAS